MGNSATTPIPGQGGSAVTDAVADLLLQPNAETSAVVIEGEPGIGKTTQWLAALDHAHERGYRTLTTTAVAAESVLTYAGATDLLKDVDATTLANVPEPQRVALEQVTLRTGAGVAPTDQRAVAAGFLSVVEILADQAPVLLAVDDLQWLDPSSVAVLAFAARRLPARAAVLATVRTDDTRDTIAWLQLRRPDALRRVRLGPLSLGGLHAVLRERIHRPISRRSLVRIHQISGGNPFYALELARAMDDGEDDAAFKLPGTLAQLVNARLGRLRPELSDVLLAAACPAAPTVDLIAGAVGTEVQHVLPLLEEAEGSGIVVFDGSRVRFAHPLLAHGVYADASPTRRRQMHRRVAELVDQPELRARHLALAATSGDSETFEALDAAAETARRRGAPATAGELLDLAVGLGGDTPERRIRLARYLTEAGEPGRARALLEDALVRLPLNGYRAKTLSTLGFVSINDDSFLEAVDLFEQALEAVEDDLALRVTILITLTFALYNAGRLDAAVDTAERAVAAANRLGNDPLLSQALGIRVVAVFTRGGSLDHASLRRALELEDPGVDTPITMRPSMHSAQLLSWTGHLDEAHEQMHALRRRCIEHGHETDVLYVAFQNFYVEIWRGNFTEADLIAEDNVARAQQLGGDVPLCAALSMRAGVAAYAGREPDVRSDVEAALAAARRCGSPMLAQIPIAFLGFFEVSLGNHDAALATLEPLLSTFDIGSGRTELTDAHFVPDAVEAMIHLGRHGEAEPLIDLLGRNGRRLDRAWMLAVAGRCRAMLLASVGDLDGARREAHQAMAEHQRLPMPFERARTQLLLGQLLRRQRRKELSANNIRDALAAFESLGTPLWADRARAELSRANIGPRRNTSPLTPSEQRVAELAASGMTNRDVAGALFISPKTVESNLARIYRKLDIRSRAELGRRLDQDKG